MARALGVNDPIEVAARFLGISDSQVRHLTCRRELPSIKTGKVGMGYRLIDLIEWQGSAVADHQFFHHAENQFSDLSGNPGGSR